MILHSISLQNFRQHADSVVYFPPTGVIGIIGANEGGKSTILEAISYALYGTQAIRGSKSSIRWNRATERRQASVLLQFEIGGMGYIAWRTETDASITEMGMGAIVARGTAPVNEFVPGLLGMNYDEFNATFLCSQKQLGAIAAMKGTERRQFFLSVMGVGRVDTAISSCRASKNALGREVEGMSAGIGSREPLEKEAEAAATEISSLDKQLRIVLELGPKLKESLEAAVGAVTESSDALRRFQEIDTELQVAKQRGMSADKEIERFSDATTLAAQAKARLVGSNDIITKLTLRRQARDEIRTANAILGQRDTINESITQLEGYIELSRRSCMAAREEIAHYDSEAHAAAIEHHSALVGEAEQLASQRAADKSRLGALIEAKDSELRRCDRRYQAILDAGNDGACPTCSRLLGDQFDTVVSGLGTEIHDLKAAIAALREQVSTVQRMSERERVLQTEIQKLTGVIASANDSRQRAQVATAHVEKELARIEELVDHLDALRSRLAGLAQVARPKAGELEAIDQEIVELEARAREAERDRAVAETLPRIQEQVAAARDAARTIHEDIARLEAAAITTNWDPQEHERLRASEIEAREAVDKQKEVRTGITAQIHATEQRRDRAAAAIAAYDDRAKALTTLQAELHTHELTEKRLVQFRTDLASSIRPEMEELVSGFVSILTDGRHESATINEDFEVTLQESGIDVEVVSGGTEDVTAFAMRLAVSQMVAERAGHPLSLLILDEPFTAVDDVRRGNALNLIRRLSETFPQVIVISHVPEIREAADHIIEVRFDEGEGRSRVVSQAVQSDPAEVSAGAAA